MIDLERRRRIEAICDAALDCPANARAAFVITACGDDETLRHQVEALLMHVKTADDFLAEPIDRVAAEVFSWPSESAETVSESAPVHAISAWPFLCLGALVILRASLFAFALATETWHSNPSRMVPASVQMTQSAFFALLAFVLLRYGRADRRAWSLGLFMLDVAATLLVPFVRATAAPSQLTVFALHIPTDAFQAAMLWFFASAFPAPAKSSGLRSAFSIGATASFCLGIILAGSDLYSLIGGVSPGWLTYAASMLRHSVGGSDWYFSLQVLALAPLLLVVALKIRETGPGDRRRFAWLALGIVIGFLPLTVEVILVSLWPTSQLAGLTDRYPHLWGGIVVGALTIAPLAAAYAALVQRTLDVRLVVRAALQHMLARSFVAVASVVPLGALVALILANRTRPVADLITGGLGATLATLALVGAAAAVMRRRLSAAVDARFYREAVDAKAAFLAVADAVRAATTLEAFRDSIVGAISDAFHPASIVTCVVAASGDLHALDADLDPLPGGSPLAQLLGGNDSPIVLEGRPSSLLLRLPFNDREWLARTKAALLLPLREVNGALAGVIALGEKKSELQYTMDDQTLLTALATTGGLTLGRIARGGGETRVSSTSVEELPARECVECGSVLHHDVISCHCGGLLQRSAVPEVLGDRLRFERRIGRGGTGVVYRAIDLRLNQRRAVKTLPGTDPVVMARLRREARAMAAVQHPHVAVLHGLEIWRDAPLLVMEHFEQTLADRIGDGPLALSETMKVGIELARGLEALHASGMLHRDIKPSNIGFTLTGVPKLLDFGLAKLARTTASAPLAEGQEGSTWSESILTGPSTIPGTPAYLSPWVLAGARPSPADDVWSLTVTLLEACTGVNPFRGATIAATIVRVLSDSGRVAEAVSLLPPQARELFADLLSTRARSAVNATAFAQRLTASAI